MPGTYGRVISGGLWLSGARIIINLLGFVSTIILARLLAPSDFGLVALGMTVMAIISSVTEMSLSQALVYQANPTAEHLNTAWTLSAVRGSILAIIMYAGAAPFALLYGDTRLELILYVLAFSTFASGLSNPSLALLTKKLIFWQSFLLQIVEKVITVIASIFLAVAWESYWAIIVGSLIGQITKIFLSYAILPFFPRPSLIHTREMFSFSVWLTLGQAMNTINWRFDQLLVGGILGNTSLGYYSVGSNLAQIPTREVSAPLRSVLFPGLASIASEPGRMRFAYQRAQSLITTLALPVGIGFALIAQPFVALTMGEKWLPAVPVIQALSCVFALQTLGSMVQPLGMALGQTKYLFVRDFQMFLVRLPIIIIGTLVWSLPGLIYGRVIAGLIATFVNMALVTKMTGLTVWSQLVVNGRSLMAVIAMVASILVFQNLIRRDVSFPQYLPIIEIFGSVSIGCLTYLATLLLCWIVKRPEYGGENEVARFIKMIWTRRSARKL